MRAFVLIIVLVLLVAVARLLWVVVPASGALTSLEPQRVETCTRVDVAPGTEDVQVDRETGLVFVSSTDRRSEEQPGGGIYVFDIDAMGMPQLVSQDAPADFRPHGISLWQGEDGVKRLFAISHPVAGGQVVEMFDVSDGGQLSHTQSVSFDAMYSPNDLVAVGPDAFYASNDRGSMGGFVQAVEPYFGLPLSSVVYWDGSGGRVAADTLVYANGINVNADGSKLYVAEVLARRVSVYGRDAETGTLTFEETFPVDTNPDNIDVAEDGALWVAGHPSIFEFLGHVEDPSAVAPSHVVRIDAETGETTTEFVDLDGSISASSVGAVVGERLVVGAVFQGHVMVCPLGG